METKRKLRAKISKLEKMLQEEKEKVQRIEASGCRMPGTCRDCKYSRWVKNEDGIYSERCLKDASCPDFEIR